MSHNRTESIILTRLAQTLHETAESGLPKSPVRPWVNGFSRFSIVELQTLEMMILNEQTWTLLSSNSAVSWKGLLCYDASIEILERDKPSRGNTQDEPNLLVPLVEGLFNKSHMQQISNNSTPVVSLEELIVRNAELCFPGLLYQQMALFVINQVDHPCIVKYLGLASSISAVEWVLAVDDVLSRLSAAELELIEPFLENPIPALLEAPDVPTALDRLDQRMGLRRALEQEFTRLEAEFRGLLSPILSAAPVPAFYQWRSNFLLSRLLEEFREKASEELPQRASLTQAMSTEIYGKLSGLIAFAVSDIKLQSEEIQSSLTAHCASLERLYQPGQGVPFKAEDFQSLAAKKEEFNLYTRTLSDFLKYTTMLSDASGTHDLHPAVIGVKNSLKSAKKLLKDRRNDYDRLHGVYEGIAARRQALSAIEETVIPSVDRALRTRDFTLDTIKALLDGKASVALPVQDNPLAPPDQALLQPYLEALGQTAGACGNRLEELHTEAVQWIASTVGDLERRIRAVGPTCQSRRLKDELEGVRDGAEMYRQMADLLGKPILSARAQEAHRRLNGLIAEYMETFSKRQQDLASLLGQLTQMNGGLTTTPIELASRRVALHREAKDRIEKCRSWSQDDALEEQLAAVNSAWTTIDKSVQDGLAKLLERLNPLYKSADTAFGAALDTAQALGPARAAVNNLDEVAKQALDGDGRHPLLDNVAAKRNGYATKLAAAEKRYATLKAHRKGEVVRLSDLADAWQQTLKSETLKATSLDDLVKILEGIQDATSAAVTLKTDDAFKAQGLSLQARFRHRGTVAYQALEQRVTDQVKLAKQAIPTLDRESYPGLRQLRDLKAQLLGLDKYLALSQGLDKVRKTRDAACAQIAQIDGVYRARLSTEALKAYGPVKKLAAHAQPDSFEERLGLARAALQALDAYLGLFARRHGDPELASYSSQLAAFDAHSAALHRAVYDTLMAARKAREGHEQRLQDAKTEAKRQEARPWIAAPSKWWHLHRLRTSIAAHEELRGDMAQTEKALAECNAEAHRIYFEAAYAMTPLVIEVHDQGGRPQQEIRIEDPAFLRRFLNEPFEHHDAALRGMLVPYLRSQGRAQEAAWFTQYHPTLPYDPQKLPRALSYLAKPKAGQPGAARINCLVVQTDLPAQPDASGKIVLFPKPEPPA